jgi:hypothetical protein
MAERPWLAKNPTRIDGHLDVLRLLRSMFGLENPSTRRSRRILSGTSSLFLAGCQAYYIYRFLPLLDAEQDEDEAVLKERLSSWTLDRLREEGYCLTGMAAFWLEKPQFGRPVASFLLGPGISLPEHRFEYVIWSFFLFDYLNSSQQRHASSCVSH